MNRDRSASESTLTDARRRAFTRSALWLGFGGWGLIPIASADTSPPAEPIAAALATLAQMSGNRPTASSRVRLTLPRLIENGAVVPVSVTAELPDVREIYVLADMNPAPIAAQFRIGPGVAPRISVRIKLADSGRVYGAVRTQNGLYWTSDVANVTVGGCS